MSGEGDPAALFRQEAGELVAAIEAGLLALEEHPDDGARIAALFRDLHTVKGSGALFGHAELAAFVHALESALERLRRGEALASAPVVALSLRACDQIRALLADPVAAAPAGAPLLAALADALGPAAPSAPPEPDAPPPGSTAVRFRLPGDALRLGHNPLLLLQELLALAPAGRVLAHTDAIPPLDALSPTDCYTGWTVELEGAVDPEAIREVFLFLPASMALAIALPGEPLADPAAAAPARAAAPGPAGPAQKAPPPAAARAGGEETLRVSAQRLDGLMDLVGELVIAKARLEALAPGLHDPALAAVTEDIRRLAGELRDATTAMRMVPIGAVVGRFRRLVHDLSAELGKPIRFRVAGEDTELDKTVIELLIDPLVHILRNAADHGIETPQARAARGKPEHGEIVLEAAYCGAEVLITVRDDGCGLNPDRIRRRAVEAGLLAETAQPTEAELYRLVLTAGFTTAEEVTVLSGRGVGMDVVRQTVEELRGGIDIESEPGYGTTVRLRLPLTLAIIEGLLVGVGGERYTIPLAAVEECLEISPREARGGAGAAFLNIRGALVPFLRLRELFAVEAPPAAHPKAVVVMSGGARVGLVVDQIVASSQIVIKELPRLHAGLRGFCGATILSAGTIALILDVAQLVALARGADAPGGLGRAA